MTYQIRQGTIEDLEEITRVEADCFPAAEAADREAFQKRLTAFPECFFVAETDGEDGREIIGFINGAAVDEKTICDEMFEDTGWHKRDGRYQSIFGLDVRKEWRRQGVAAALMEHMIENARKKGRDGLILTCKDRLIHYYEKFGYRNLGVSASVHGGAVWYDMILEFSDQKSCCSEPVSFEKG